MFYSFVFRPFLFFFLFLAIPFLKKKKKKLLLVLFHLYAEVNQKIFQQTKTRCWLNGMDRPRWGEGEEGSLFVPVCFPASNKLSQLLSFHRCCSFILIKDKRERNCEKERFLRWFCRSRFFIPSAPPKPQPSDFVSFLHSVYSTKENL